MFIFLLPVCMSSVFNEELGLVFFPIPDPPKIVFQNRVKLRVPVIQELSESPPLPSPLPSRLASLPVSLSPLPFRLASLPVSPPSLLPSRLAPSPVSLPSSQAVPADSLPSRLASSPVSPPLASQTVDPVPKIRVPSVPSLPTGDGIVCLSRRVQAKGRKRYLCKYVGCAKFSREGRDRACITHGGGKRCTVVGCVNGAVSGKETCFRHEPNPLLCSFPDCTRRQRSGGLCKCHQRSHGT